MKHSAGILLYRKRKNIEYFLTHPGGPYWSHKDLGSWSIPKGLLESGESSLEAALREFKEETGFQALGDLLELGSVKPHSNRIITAYALEMDLDPEKVVCNSCIIEWPPKSGKKMEIVENDKAEWFDYSKALEKIFKSQREFLFRLQNILNSSPL